MPPLRKDSASSPHKLPPGFLPGRRAHEPIKDMSEFQLRDLHRRNANILAKEPGTSASPNISRIHSEQGQIERRLADIDALQLDRDLRDALKIDPTSPTTDVSQPSGLSPPSSSTIDAKKRAIASATKSTGRIGTIDMSEAMELERRAQQLDRERKARLEEKRIRHGYPAPSAEMSRKEREARIWAFMNHKPTDSDLEDDSDEDPDEEDPATWFDDDQDDGIKGQDIVQPDEVDYSDIIRVDERNVHAYSTFYEPRDDGD